MEFRLSSDKLVIFSYFIGIILVGSLLLMIPGAWAGERSLRYVDALFTATSAVCVTGLITVDTALYSRFGQGIILLLIQAGGLGIITFAAIYVTNPRKRISLVNRGMIRDYYVEEVDYNPRDIIRHVLVTTFSIEIVGAILLSFSFQNRSDVAFVSFFHAVSAFCNAGFSTFSDSLEAYATDPLVNFTIIALLVSGGIGFMVLRDLGKRILGKKRRLSYHSRIAIRVSLVLLIIGTVLFFLIERKGAFSSLSLPNKLMAAFFQSATPRTAGFDTIAQSSLSGASLLLVLLFMFIGASPASTGGGVKTTTFYIILLAALRGGDEKGNLTLGKRIVPAKLIIKALGIIGKALVIIVVATAAVLVLESGAVGRGEIEIVEIIFEVVSAFGTVGLSLGITSALGDAAKLVLILTMFAGRVGLFAMAIPGAKRRIERYVDLPETSMLVG